MSWLLKVVGALLVIWAIRAVLRGESKGSRPILGIDQEAWAISLACVAGVLLFLWAQHV